MESQRLMLSIMANDGVGEGGEGSPQLSVWLDGKSHKQVSGLTDRWDMSGRQKMKQCPGLVPWPAAFLTRCHVAHPDWLQAHAPAANERYKGQRFDKARVIVE